MGEGDVLFTVAQVAEKLQVHEKTVKRWLLSADLKGIRVGRQWRIASQDLDAFLVERKADSVSRGC